MSGVQFILIWILGEYVGRVYGDVRQRPKYVVGATSQNDLPTAEK